MAALPGVAASSSRAARKDASARRATLCAKGRVATDFQASVWLKGLRVSSKPRRTPTPRPATWARMGRPSAVAAERAARRSRQALGAFGPCSRLKDRGRPEASTSRRIRPNSAWGSAKSETNCSTPRPAAFSPRAIPISSSSAAVRVGVGWPSEVRWLRVREVEKPRAPASMARFARADMAAISAGLAGSRLAPRSPMTKTRRAACGSWAPTSRS